MQSASENDRKVGGAAGDRGHPRRVPPCGSPPVPWEASAWLGDVQVLGERWERVCVVPAERRPAPAEGFPGLPGLGCFYIRQVHSGRRCGIRRRRA